MYGHIVFCSQLNLFQWLQNYLLPCPFKSLTGIDCPGCGFQRSVIALLKGNLHDSWLLYPASIPFIVTAIFVFLDMRFHWDKTNILKKALYVITGNMMAIAYLFKMYHTYV